MSPSFFGESARRHLRDAELLLEQDRVSNADHLSGFAAESALKALVLESLGGYKQGRFAYTAGNEAMKGHANQTWATVAALVHGRSEPALVELTSGTNPFSNWNVDDRYARDDHVPQERASLHLEAARLALRTLDAVWLSNMNGVRA